MARVFLAGDVMTGRAIDQILPYPGRPNLYESFVRDARVYIHLAEQKNGVIPRPVPFKYIWGDVLPTLNEQNMTCRIINLETAITTSEKALIGKPVLYRMHPRNIGCLTEAGITCCTLANNHVLDWGYEGLKDTLKTLAEHGISTTGAGLSKNEAEVPSILQVDEKRVLVFAFGAFDSGVPESWAATDDRAGVNYLGDYSDKTVAMVRCTIEKFRQAGDTVFVSIHWGSNWDVEVPPEHRKFAHALLDSCGVDVLFGHSSHHVKPMERFKGRLILYGCGDFINDYEGIEGHEEYRPELTRGYVVNVQDRRVETLPFERRQLSLHVARPEDAAWLNQHYPNAESSSETMA